MGECFFLLFYYLSNMAALSTGALSFLFLIWKERNKHTTLKIVLSFVCSVFSGEMTVLMVDKDKAFTAAIGDNVTLECFIRSDFVAKYYWYKEIIGDFPRLVSSFYTFDESAKFYDEFANNSRFALDVKKEQNHLMIANLQHSDTGTYYCANSFSEKLEFKDGITIIIKGSGLNIPVFIQRPENHFNQSEGARFNCSAHGRAIYQEHGVYQLRTSEKSDPGALYTWKNNTCYYSLPANNLAVDCAAVTCGHILKLPQKQPRAEGESVLSKKLNMRQCII